ncbi:hypothetical protein INR49_027863, partial [Caranx melampygus]
MFLKQYLTLFLLIAVLICKAKSCDKFTDLNLGHAFLGTSINPRLLLYTRENVTCGTLLSHTNLSLHPQFDMSRPTTFIIHGFRPTGSPPVWLSNITELLLARKDCNLIVVDWNYGAANVNYFKAVENTYKAAANLTAFIKVMQEHGASLSSIHLIGVSLGAHMSGVVGANLNRKIGRITALDPAGPQFTGTAPEDRLDPSDAQFVDVLHTDIDALGFREPLGHIDFYPNAGTDQPGCPRTIFSGGSYFKCDHQRSVFLYLESVRQTCTSRVFPCSSYSDFLDGKCMNCDQFGAAGCPVFVSCYRVDMMVWNKDVHWGYITVKLHHNGTEAVATIDHKSIEFQQYKETTLLAQFDKDIQSVDKVSLTFTSGKIGLSKHKLRVLQIQLTHLERKERSLCRYDIVLEEKTEVTFRPIPLWRGDITEQLLARKDLNLIIVDWNYGATTVNYLKAVENSHKVAANLTAFIKVMQEHGASLSSIHLIGESLGAHMSGFVGANLNGSIGRITALEPAKPQFTGTAPEDRLDSSDAQFVDVVHTDIDSLGFREPLGHIDFYANGGTDQPGCPKTIFSGGSYFKCDHQRAMYLFLESVKKTCTSRVFPCSSYSAFLDGKCMNCDQFGPAGCPVFGYDVIKWKDILVKLGQTKTYFTTNPESPFCMSCYRVDMMVWNKDVYWGYITVKLHHNGTEAVATIDHKSTEFQQYKETTLLAQFNKDVQSVDKVSLTFTSGNIGLSKHKLRVLRIQLTHLEWKERSLCRYDVVLEEKTEVTFRPIPCEPSLEDELGLGGQWDKTTRSRFSIGEDLWSVTKEVIR